MPIRGSSRLPSLRVDSGQCRPQTSIGARRHRVSLSNDDVPHRGQNGETARNHMKSQTDKTSV
jgi:hypothetical protein